MVLKKGRPQLPKSAWVADWMVSKGWFSILRTPRVRRNSQNHQSAEPFFRQARPPIFLRRQPERPWWLAIDPAGRAHSGLHGGRIHHDRGADRISGTEA